MNVKYKILLFLFAILVINKGGNAQFEQSNGLAKADSLFGPWSRISMKKPVSRHTENPIVTKLDDGRFIAFFDGCGQHQRFGYMLSDDGLHWSQPQIMDQNEHPSK